MRFSGLASVMTYALIAWKKPQGLAAPTDVTEANALLSERRASRRRPSSRFIALGEAMHERFPPGFSIDHATNDVWVDASEYGNTVEPVFTFDLNERGRHFEAAYQHAVVQARRLGLNIHDPQNGEHHLVDGRRLPHGTPIDATTAARAWRMSDWDGAIRDYRKAITQGGSATALHDLAQAIRHGLGDLPVHVLLAGAMMQVAAAKDDVRRRQRLATLQMLEPDLRDLQTSLRNELRAAKDVLAVVDRELKATITERQRLDALPRVPAKYTKDDWWSLQLQARCGDYWAAWRLANAFKPATATLARPPWTPEHGAWMHYVMLAARLGSSYSQRRVAEGLASGEEGWPHDPAQALEWMKRALASGEPGLTAPVARLKRRLAQGWNPAADRDRAEDVLRNAGYRSGEERVTLLRRACELDHPDAWRMLGTAYLRGTDGLPKDAVIGAALMLAAQKTLAATDAELGRDKPAPLSGITSDDIDDALRLAHNLMGGTDPWITIAQHRHGLPAAPIPDDDDDFDTLVSMISPGRER